MAQPNPVKPAESKPTLVSVESTPARTGAKEPKRSNTGIWILAAIAGLLAIFALWQSQQLTDAGARIVTLEDRVLGLESQLSSAHTQIQTYEMQRGLVRDAVTDISDRMNLLREMVGAGPALGASALMATETPVATAEEAPAAPAAAAETLPDAAPLEATPVP